MINIGLKLWTNNIANFSEAIDLYRNKYIQFVEIYYNAAQDIDMDKLSMLKNIPVNLHCTEYEGFESFDIGKKEIDIWAQIVKLADFFSSKYIIVHPGRKHTFKTFLKNLEIIEDKRILIENMPGLDVLDQEMYAYKLDDLVKISKYNKVCYDFEKAIKSAIYQRMDYKEYILDSIKNLSPFYYHISGCDTINPRDEHKDLWDCGFDIKWIKSNMEKISKDKNIYLVFETPRRNNNLKNDYLNMKYFNELKID